jgi:hypothetical protein
MQYLFNIFEMNENDELFQYIICGYYIASTLLLIVLFKAQIINYFLKIVILYRCFSYSQKIALFVIKQRHTFRL